MAYDKLKEYIKSYGETCARGVIEPKVINIYDFCEAQAEEILKVILKEYNIFPRKKVKE